MRLFVGVYHRVLDDHGRLCIPARLAAALERRALHLAPTAHPALALYPDADVLPNCPSVTVPVDRRGRIAIPLPLRQAAGLSRQVVLVGAGRHMEVWDAQRFERVRQRITKAANDGGPRTQSA